MPHTPLISVVVTVYNKEAYLPATVRSLTEQDGELAVEYIFVDDRSTDRSIAVLEEATKHLHDVSIIQNSDNHGPSIRINQGVRLARGKYVLCFDSDDILAANALQVMSSALTEHKADVIYGNWQKTKLAGDDLLSKRIGNNPTIDVSDAPLTTVLNGRFLRMQFMARRDVFLKAEGADERIFIQDESIPLRLATHAKRWLKLHDTVMYVPHIEGALSNNVAQLNHDRFYAHYNLLKDYPSLPEHERRGIYRRAISAGWKQIRSEKSSCAILHWIFPAYLKSRSAQAAINLETLKKVEQHMRQLDGVRRVSN